MKEILNIYLEVISGGIGNEGIEGETENRQMESLTSNRNWLCLASLLATNADN